MPQTQFMKYYSLKEVNDKDLSTVRSRVEAALKEEGFGVLTEIDIQATMKKKLDKDYPPHLILGACNPSFADQALQKEANISTLLPCNVTIKQNSKGNFEVAVVNPEASMSSVENEALKPLASEVKTAMERALERL